jgi:hypothetical protein
MGHWVQTHGFDMMLFYFLYSALVSPMPEPTSKSSQGYRYVYGVAHSLAGNLKNVAKAVSPITMTTAMEASDDVVEAAAQVQKDAAVVKDAAEVARTAADDEASLKRLYPEKK